MMTEARRNRGVRGGVTDDELWRMHEQGMSGSEIGRKIGRTTQAVNQRLKRIREQRRDESDSYLLPWAVRATHATGYVYRAISAYAHRQRGEALTPRQRTELAELEEFLHQHDAVVTYDYNEGWLIRNRRPEDGRRLVV